MGARVLKWKWPTATERELYAGNHVWVYENEQDCNGAYLCEMRSGPKSGLLYWFKETEFLPASKTGSILNQDTL